MPVRRDKVKTIKGDSHLFAASGGLAVAAAGELGRLGERTAERVRTGGLTPLRPA